MWISHGLMFFAGATIGSVFMAMLQMERLERRFSDEPDWVDGSLPRRYLHSGRHLRLVDRDK